MSNVIPRKAKKLDVQFLDRENGHMVVIKDGHGWLGTDDNGKQWRIFPSHLRISELCRILEVTT